MPLKRYRTRNTPHNQDSYESTSQSSLDSELHFSPVPTKRNRLIRSSARLATTLPDPTIRTRLSRRTRCPTVSPSRNLSPPTIRRTPRTGKQPAPQTRNQSPANRPASSARRVSHAPSAADLKRIEKEMAKTAEHRRENKVAVLSDRVMSGLLAMGDLSRDVAQVCSGKLGWKEDEWKAWIKDAKVIVYEPIEQHALRSRKRAHSSARKPLSQHPSTNWSLSLQVSALSLCITKAGAHRVCLQNEEDHHLSNFTSHADKSLAWDHVDGLSEIRTVFVHRNVIQEFLSDRSSVVDLVRSEPRVQFFTFGGAGQVNSPPADPRIEMILCAGAVVVPTFDSLFKNSSDADQKKRRECFEKMKEVCHVNPFVKICLHPSMKSQLSKKLAHAGDEIDMDFLVDFLAHEFDCPKQDDQANCLREWIELDRNIIAWLWADPRQSRYEDPDDDAFELAMIAKTLAQIRIESYTTFRRFIIAIPDEHIHPDRISLEGIELMKISELSALLPCGLI